MAKKTEKYIRKCVIRPKGESEGTPFSVKIYYDTALNEFVVFFENRDRAKGKTESDALEAAENHAKTLITTTEKKIIRISWEYDRFNHLSSNNAHRVDLKFSWAVFKVKSRIKIDKGHKDVEQVQYARLQDRDEDFYLIETAFRDCKGWMTIEERKEDRQHLKDEESEFPYSIELETFCTEMEKRLRILAEQISKMIGPDNINHEKLLDVGTEFLNRMLPSGRADDDNTE